MIDSDSYDEDVREVAAFIKRELDKVADYTYQVNGKNYKIEKNDQVIVKYGHFYYEPEANSKSYTPTHIIHNGHYTIYETKEGT